MRRRRAPPPGRLSGPSGRAGLGRRRPGQQRSRLTHPVLPPDPPPQLTERRVELVDTGVVSLGDVEAKQHELAYLPPGSQRLTIEAVADARVLLLGGPPFGEAIVMWWNFVGRSHEDVVAFREAWMAQLADGGYADGRFGIPTGDDQPPIPAPPLPNARLKERR